MCTILHQYIGNLLKDKNRLKLLANTEATFSLSLLQRQIRLWSCSEDFVSAANFKKCVRKESI